MNAESIYRRTIYKESISKENWQRSQIAACAASRRKYSYLNKHSWKTAQYSLYSIFTEGCKMIPASLREAAEGRLDIHTWGKPLHWYFKGFQEVSVISLCWGRSAIFNLATASAAR